MISSIVIKYSLQAGISLSILYIFYAVFLRRENRHQLNRVYLLVSMISALLIPLFKPEISIAATAEPTYYVVLDTISIHAGKIQESVTNHLSFYQVLLTVYLTGVAVFSIRFFAQLLQFAFMVRRNRRQNGQGFTIVQIKNANPFSFFQYIFLDEDLLNEEDKACIIAHERQHIRQWHSADLILTEIVLIFQWFNPVIWFYRIALREVHEYLADHAVLASGHNINAYRELLLNISLGSKKGYLGSNFNKSLIFKRIKMMYIEQKSKTAGLKAAFSLIAGLAISFLIIVNPVQQIQAQTTKEVKEKAASKDDNNVQVVEAKNAKEDKDAPVFTVVEVMPEFPQGRAAFIKYLAANVKYPEQARKDRIHGTVYVSFVVAKDGRIKDAKVLRGVRADLDKEALRVVKNMPKWKPGTQRGKPVNVAFNVPIKFVLDKDKDEKESSSLEKK
jgi:TonB family protein